MLFNVSAVKFASLVVAFDIVAVTLTIKCCVSSFHLSSKFFFVP